MRITAQDFLRDHLDFSDVTMGKKNRGTANQRRAANNTRPRSGHITTDDSEARQQHTTTATHNHSPPRAVTLPTAPSMINRRIVFINKPSYTYDVLLDEGRLAGSVIHRTPSSALHVGAM